MDYSAKLLKFLAIIVNLLFGGILNAADTTLIDVINLPYSVHSIASDSAGTVWLTGARGLQYYDFEKENFITSDASYKFFIIAENGQIVKYQSSSDQLGFPWGRFEPWLVKVPPGIKRLTAAKDKFGQYWVSTGKQLFIFSVEDRFDQTLSAYSTRGIYQDKGDLYVNTYSGILRNGSKIFERPNFAGGEIKKFGEALYFAWGGLFRYQPRTQAVDYLSLNLSRRTSPIKDPRPNNVRSLQQNRDTIWVGTKFGLGFIQNDSVVMVSNFPDIHDMACFENGLLIAGSKLLKPGTSSIPHHNLPVPNCKDCRGMYLWQENQLRKLDVPELNYRYILEADENYYFASDSGVVVWNGEKVTNVITEDDGLTNNQTCSLVMDDNGFLWVSTFSGLNRVNLSNGKITQYLKSIEFNYHSVFKNDSLIYIGSVQGVYSFSPVKFLQDDVEPVPPWATKQYLTLFGGVTIPFISLLFYLVWRRNRRKVQLKDKQIKEMERKLFLVQIDQIVLNTEMAITVSSLAHSLDISERTLYRTFKEYDLTPGIYLKELKLKKAKYLIKDDRIKQNLKEVAQKVGYTESYLKKLLQE
jgi:AraC-like DNA-binding protein